MYAILRNTQTFAQSIDYNTHIYKILNAFEKCKGEGELIISN